MLNILKNNNPWDENDIWTRRSRGRKKSPLDLDAWLNKGGGFFQKLKPSEDTPFHFLGVVLGVILLVWAASGLYQVAPDERGVVLRFGRVVETTTPGLHYHFPYPFEQVYTPKVTRINKVEVGFRSALSRAGTTVEGRDDFTDESLMLTGDENIVDVNFTVSWLIEDPVKYLFRTRIPEETVKAAAESAMREVIGQKTLSSALTEGRAEIEMRVQQLLQNMMNAYSTGILIDKVELQKVAPPPSVIDAYRDVVAAKANLESMRNRAEAYRNEVLPQARGEAERIRQDAEAYEQETISRAGGEAERFQSVLSAYKVGDPEVTKQRLYLETVENVLGNTRKMVVDPKGGVLPHAAIQDMLSF